MRLCAGRLLLCAQIRSSTACRANNSTTASLYTSSPFTIPSGSKIYCNVQYDDTKNAYSTVVNQSVPLLTGSSQVIGSDSLVRSRTKARLSRQNVALYNFMSFSSFQQSETCNCSVRPFTKKKSQHCALRHKIHSVDDVYSRGSLGLHFTIIIISQWRC